MTTIATVRNVSKGGISFVAAAHFVRHTELVVGIDITPEQTRRLAGTVVYSRCVSDNLYLTGVRFGPVDDSLMKIAIEQDQAVKAILQNPDPH